LAAWCAHTLPAKYRGVFTESRGDIDCCVTFQGKADLHSHAGQRANEDDRLGLIKIVARSNGPILGASIVGEGAVETITEIAIAMRNMLKLADLTATNKPYPTYSTGVQLLAT
jgi:pyruvate/2-oxoglutarate dehydrogenase complex dihydrolipoamide dehydrogenase (E3) component